jgi:hypothetical protein
VLLHVLDDNGLFSLFVHSHVIIMKLRSTVASSLKLGASQHGLPGLVRGIILNIFTYNLFFAMKVRIRLNHNEPLTIQKKKT